MKKVMIVFAMSVMVMTIATVKAEGAMKGKNAVENIENNSMVVEEAQANADSVTYKVRIRLRDMNKAMHLDVDQIEDLQLTNNELTRRIARLENVPAAERQAKLAVIVAENLASVREMVVEAQYRAYLTLLNNEFNKTGLNTILYGYNTLAEK